MSPVPDEPTVVTLEGELGRILSDATETHNGEHNVLVNFDSGERLWVPADRLILQEDGHFQLNMPLHELSAQYTRPTIAARPASLDAQLAAAPMEVTQRMPVPPAEAVQPAPPAPDDDLEVPDFSIPPAPQPEAETPADDGPQHVQLTRVVESYREDIGASLLREDVEIDRIPVNEYVDEAPPIRYEDDRIIIPVLEEVLQVEKKLLVKEEVVVTKRRTQAAVEQRELRQTTHVMAAPAGTEDGSDRVELYRRHYDSQRYPGAHGFAYYEPAYRFGEALRASARFSGQGWESVEPVAREQWERDNPGTWDTVQPAVRYAWSGQAGPA